MPILNKAYPATDQADISRLASSPIDIFL